LRAIAPGNAAKDSRRLLSHPFCRDWRVLWNVPVNKGEKFEDFVAFDY